MKKTEIILTIIGLSSLIGIWATIDGAKEVCLLSLTLLSCIYLIFSFALLNNIPFRKLFKKASYKSISIARMIGSIVYGWAMSSAVLSVVFRALGYTGAKEMLLIGLISLTVTLMITLYAYKQQVSFYKGVIIRSMMWGSLVMVLFFMI